MKKFLKNNYTIILLGDHLEKIMIYSQHLQEKENIEMLTKSIPSEKYTKIPNHLHVYVHAKLPSQKQGARC